MANKNGTAKKNPKASAVGKKPRKPRAVGKIGAGKPRKQKVTAKENKKQKQKAPLAPPEFDRASPGADSSEDDVSDEDEEDFDEENEEAMVVNDNKIWTKSELLIIARTVSYVKSQQGAKTVAGRRLRKWKECKKALAEQNMLRSSRAISQRWRKLCKDWRAMNDLKNKKNGKGGNRRGINYRFLKDFENYISAKTEALKPSFVIKTNHMSNRFVPPLKINGSANPLSGQKKSVGEQNTTNDQGVDENVPADLSALIGGNRRTTEIPIRSMDDEDDVILLHETGENGEEQTEFMVRPTEKLGDDEEEQEQQTESLVGPTENGTRTTTTTTTRPTGTEPIIRRVEIASPVNIGDLFRMRKTVPKAQYKDTGYHKNLIKGTMVAVKCSSVYNETEAPHLGSGEVVPVIIQGSHRLPLFDVLTMDGERVDNLPKGMIEGLILNQDDYFTHDCMEERIKIGENVFIRDGFQEKHYDLKRMGEQKARNVEYTVLGGSDVAVVLGRKNEKGDKYKVVIGRRTEQIIATRNRQTPNISVPTYVNLPPRTFDCDDLPRLGDEMNRMKQTVHKGIKFGYGCLVDENVYFCVINSSLEGSGPILQGTNGMKKPLSSFPGCSDMEIVEPGEQKTEGTNGIEIRRGDSVAFTREGNVDDFGTAICVAFDHILVQSHREGINAKYEVVGNHQCIQTNKLVTTNLEEVQDAIRARAAKDREPVYLPRKPQFRRIDDSDTEAERRMDDSDAEVEEDDISLKNLLNTLGHGGDEKGATGKQSRDKNLGSKNAKKTDKKPTQKPKKPAPKKNGRKKKSKKDGDDDDESDENVEPARKTAKVFGHEIAAALLPGFQDMLTGSWQNKRDYATELHNRAQMHATIQIQAAIQYLIEARRAESARQERQLYELMKMAVARHEAMMRLMELMTKVLEAQLVVGSRNPDIETRNLNVRNERVIFADLLRETLHSFERETPQPPQPEPNDSVEAEDLSALLRNGPKNLSDEDRTRGLD